MSTYRSIFGEVVNGDYSNLGKSFSPFEIGDTFYLKNRKFVVTKIYYRSFKYEHINKSYGTKEMYMTFYYYNKLQKK